VAQEYDIPVLEDAAEALGSHYHGRPMGTFGHAGVLSFNGNKIITTSSGGALISNDAGIIDKARYFRQEAREPLPYYEHKAVGYNYRMSNLLAALGGSQINVLGERIKRKREIFNYYSNRLADISGISFQSEPGGVLSNRWLTTVLFQDGGIDEQTVRHLLADNNIESRRLWKPMHLQPVFSEFPSYSNGVAERLFDSGLCLPSGTSLQDKDLCRIADLITKSFPR
jgi:dTDP-4-amino-4,6-dideoxygalactose transaminase